MQAVAKAVEAFVRVVDFLEPFELPVDHRQRGTMLYPLDGIQLLVLLGVLAGCDCWVEIARLGEAKLDLLRRFLPDKDGTPSHDPFDDIFSPFDAEQFQGCFIGWTVKLIGLSAATIAIVGKTLRRADHEILVARMPIHMISTWSCGQNLVLGRAKVSAKPNEITAIAKLLDLLTIKGATITIDAMGCQREIAAKIIEIEAHNALAPKSNQGTLRDDVETFVVEQEASKFADCVADVAETIEKCHGRIETRIVATIGDIGWLRERHDWPGLTSIVVVENRREMAGRCEREHRFYISSYAPNAPQLGETVRSH